jgi:hypothetical protein
MSTVRVYKSTDSGAPAHPTATKGTMAALLRACLVTGYGSKAPAGWSEPHVESGNIACFQAPEGARQFFQLADTQATNVNVAVMAGFESMSDVSTGLGGWGSKYFGKRSTLAGSVAWWVVADERTVYVFLDTTRGLTGHVFGEYRSFVDDDPYNSLIGGHANPSGLYTINTASVHVYGEVLFMCGARYVPQTFNSTVTSNYDGPSHAKNGVGTVGPTGSVDVGYINGATRFPDVAALSYVVATPHIINGSNGSICGKYRGVYCPLAFRPKTHGTPFELDGKTFLPLDLGYGTGGNNRGQVWLDITGTWEV